MYRSTCVFAIAICFGSLGPAFSEDKVPEVKKKVPDGVYAVLRESANEKDVLPVKEGETLVVDRQRYLKKDEKEAPRFAIVRAAPDVELDLAGEPKAEKEEMEVVRILLKLKPKAATALEKLTRDQVGKQVAIVVGEEVVTMHKVRDVIKGGDVQITSCAPGAANYLLEQLQAHWKSK